MNILFIADPDSIHDVRWINCLTADGRLKGFVISRFSHHYPSKSPKFKLNENVELVGSIKDPSVVRPWRNWYQLLKIRRIIRSKDIALLHILYAEPNALWALWKWFLKKPVVITTRGTDILKTIPLFFERASLLNRVVARRYQTALNCADYICCTSESQVGAIRRLKIITPVTIVRTGVDFNTLSATTEDIASTYGISIPFVLMPRNMKPIYNHSFTIDAIGSLNENIRSKYCFVFMNADTKDHKYFRTIQNKAAKIEADIRFLPSLSHSEFIGLCKQSSLVVMNPMSDGSPVTAMETMALGVPIILPPLEYDKDVFQHAWSFDKWESSALTTCIETVLETDEAAMMVRADASRRNVKRDADIETEMAKVQDIYAGLTE